MTDQPISKKEFCLENLKANILTMKLAPGVELDEQGVAQEYGLSRTPMREIYQVLNGEGFVTLQQNRGARVASLDVSTARYLFQTAPTVLANTARLACDHRTDDQLALAQSLVDAIEAAQEDGDAGQTALLDYQLHMLIGQMAGNSYLMPALQRVLIDQTRMSLDFYDPEKKKEKKQVRKAALQHETILAAIRDCNPERAANHSIQHWDLLQTRMDEFLKPAPLPLDATAPAAQSV
ncbi:MAG: GntR family transcriptional regulator [Pelagimonas sp.]|jgi:DNA-binding GntR family transcriptional regulator|nr:GntR family transcriptional regulator [Pelagimonas sp.]